MKRIKVYILEDAPDASRGLFEDVTRFSPTGRPLTAWSCNYAETPVDVPVPHHAAG